MTIEIGQLVPDFSLLASNGEKVKPSDFRGKNLMIYFYSKDNSPGCTKQACDLRDHIQQINEDETIIWGISSDSLKTHQKFIEKHQLPFLLLSDEEREVANIFEVYKGKKVCGKVKMGIERSTFIIDKKGIIQKIYRNVEVKKHIGEVLAFLEELQVSQTQAGYFTEEDFAVFGINDFADRMDGIKNGIGPKLQELGRIIGEKLSTKSKKSFFPHVAKHARRTVNPPNDTWVAFSSSKLGYKKLPHFEVGLNNKVVYIKMTLKAECESKKNFASRLADDKEVLSSLPKGTFQVYGLNSNSVEGKLLKDIKEEEIHVLISDLQNKKNAWIALGLEIPQKQVKDLNEGQLFKKILPILSKLYPLYDLAVGI